MAFSILASLVCRGQNVTEDLIAMGKKFNSLPAYDMTVEMRVYKKGSEAAPSFSSKGRTVKSGNKFYMNVLGRKTIVDNHIMLVVDDKQKLLIYNRINDEQMKVLSSPQNINIDSIVKSQKVKVKYLLNTEVEKKIEMQLDEGDVKTMVMSFDPKTYAIKEITYFYTEEVKKYTGNTKAVVTYSNFSMECKDKSIFSQSKFIRVKGDNVFATEAYKKYRVVRPEDFNGK